MRTQLVTVAAVLAVGLSASAKAKGASDKGTLIKNMVTACKAELAQEPVLADTTDGENIWRNLEDKEHAHTKFSKNCHHAHEAYEAKYHKEAEAGEGEHED